MARKPPTSRTPEGETLLKIRAARQRLNMSQAELARAVGIAQRTLSSYENGETTLGLDVLLQLPAALGVGIADILPASLVTAVDQRRSKDPRLEEIIINWPEISESGRDSIRAFARLIYEAEGKMRQANNGACEQTTPAVA